MSHDDGEEEGILWGWWASLFQYTDVNKKSEMLQNRHTADHAVLTKRLDVNELAILRARNTSERDALHAIREQIKEQLTNLTRTMTEAGRVQASVAGQIAQQDATAMSASLLMQTQSNQEIHKGNLKAIVSHDRNALDLKSELEVTRVQEMHRRQFQGILTEGSAGILGTDKQQGMTADQIELQRLEREEALYKSIRERNQQQQLVQDMPKKHRKGRVNHA